MNNRIADHKKFQPIAEFENWFVETEGFTFMTSIRDDRTLGTALESLGLGYLYSSIAELVCNDLAAYVVNDNTLSIRLDNSICENLEF